MLFFGYRLFSIFSRIPIRILFLSSFWSWTFLFIPGLHSSFLCLHLSFMLRVSSHGRSCLVACLYLGWRAGGRCSRMLCGLLMAESRSPPQRSLPFSSSLTGRLHFEESWGFHNCQSLSYKKNSLAFPLYSLCSFKFICWHTFQLSVEERKSKT